VAVNRVVSLAAEALEVSAAVDVVSEGVDGCADAIKVTTERTNAIGESLLNWPEWRARVG
jgi:hypothetical protein